jgi:hypothetical protein
MMRVTGAVAAVVLIFAMAGCSSEVSVGGGPGDTVAEQVEVDAQTYTSDMYGYSFDYGPPFEPQDEVTTDASGGGNAAESAAVFDVDGTQIDGQYRDAFVVNVYELDAEITPDDLDQVGAELEQSVIPQLERSSDSMKIGEITPVSVNGLPGYQADGTFMVGETAMNTRLYFIFDGAVEYQLLTQSASDRWADLEPTFRQMVDSFSVA